MPQMASDKLAEKLNRVLSKMQQLLAMGAMKVKESANGDEHDVRRLTDFHAKVVAWSVDVRVDAGSLKCVCDGPIGDHLDLIFDALREWCEEVILIFFKARLEEFELDDENKWNLEAAYCQLRGTIHVIRSAQASTSGAGLYAAMKTRIETMASAVHEASEASSEHSAAIYPIQYRTILDQVVEAVESHKDPRHLLPSFWNAMGVKSSEALAVERRAAREIETEGERRCSVAKHGTPWPAQSSFKLCDYVWWYDKTRQATESQIIAIHDEAHAPKYQIRMLDSGDVVDNVVEGDLGAISQERHDIQRQRVTEAQEKQRMEEDNESFDTLDEGKGKEIEDDDIDNE